MALWTGRPGWLGKLGLALLTAWLIILIVSVLHVLRNNSTSLDNGTPSEKENARKLSEMIKEFEILQKQNEALASLLMAETSKSGKALDNLNSRIDFEKITQVTGKNEPPLEYEELRRKLKNNIQELWYYVSAELKKVKKYTEEFPLDKRERDVDDALKNVWEHKKSLMLDWEKLTKGDGHQEWREREARELSDLVQRRFYYLQNPRNCNNAKKLTCSLNKGCGFGCQVLYLLLFFLIIKM